MKLVDELEADVKEFMGRSIAGLISDLDAERAKEVRLDAVLTYLTSLIEMAEDKPPVPECRTRAHFERGDKVLCYITDQDSFLPVERLKFMEGVVVAVNASQNYKYDRVRVKFDRCVLTCPRDDECAVWFCAGSSCVVKLEEYDKLMNDEDYRKIWLWTLQANECNDRCRWTETMSRGFDDARRVVMYD